MKAIFIKQDFDTTDLSQLNLELSDVTAIMNTISVDTGYVLITLDENDID
jgi:hypothetical protein